MASRYQLRRTGPLRNMPPSLASISLDQDCVKFGRNPDVVQIVLTSSVYANMISREHAEIRRSRLPDSTVAYHLYDRSLNGTYVNDYRVDGQILLHPGDVIQFGHINGAAIQPGQPAPQPDAEFTFVFEKVPRSLNQTQQTLDAKMAATLLSAGGANSAAGRFAAGSAAAQWSPYAHPAYFAAAGFNPYLSPMAPSFVSTYGGSLSSGTAGMIQNSVRQQDVNNAASWLGMAAAHQNQAAVAAAGMAAHHYHSNQSPAANSGSTPSPSTSAYHQTGFGQHQQQQHATPLQQLQQQSRNVIGDIERQLANVAAANAASCGVHDSSSSSGVISSRSLPSDNAPANYGGREPFQRQQQYEDRFGGGGGESPLLNAATYQSARSQADAKRMSSATVTAIACGSPAAVVGGAQQTKTSSSPSIPAASPAAATTSSVKLGGGQQQRDTVVVETPVVRTSADTSTSTPTISTSRHGCQQRQPQAAVLAATVDEEQQQKGSTLKSDLPKMECDSSVPSPPEDPIRRRSLESNRDQEEDSQHLNSDLFKLASAAQSRCLKDADVQEEDVFEITPNLGSRANETRPEKSSSPDSPLDSPPAKRSPSPLRTALLSNRTTISGNQRTSSGGAALGGGSSSSLMTSSSSSAGAIKRRRKTNEVARLLTDLSDSSFMFEVRKKEELSKKRPSASSAAKRRHRSANSSDDENVSDKDNATSNDGDSSAEDDDDDDVDSKVRKLTSAASTKVVTVAQPPPPPLSAMLFQGVKPAPTSRKPTATPPASSTTTTRRKAALMGNVKKRRKNSSSADERDSDEADEDYGDDVSLSSKRVAAEKTNKDSSSDNSSDSADSSDDDLPLKRRTAVVAVAKSEPSNSRRRGVANSLRPVAQRRPNLNAANNSSNAQRPKKEVVRKTRSTSSTGTTARNVRQKRQQPRKLVDDSLNSSVASFDVSWSYHDPTQSCASGKNCVLPTDAEVQWVQCDDCSQWFHVPCVGCDFDEIKDDDADFHCGCS